MPAYSNADGASGDARTFRVLNIVETMRLMRDAGIDPHEITGDPNLRRHLEALCIRHGVAAVYHMKETTP